MTRRALAPEAFAAWMAKNYPIIALRSNYQGSKRPIHLRCTQCGNNWQTKPESIYTWKSVGCLICVGKLRRQNSTHYIQRVAQFNSSLTVLDNYIDYRTSILHKCAICKISEYYTPRSILVAKGRCPNCSIKLALTKSEYNAKLRSFGSTLRCVGNYTLTGNPVDHYCRKCQNVWHAYPSYLVRIKGRCKLCHAKSNYSREGIKCLKAVARKLDISVQTAIDGREFRVPILNIFADGYCREYELVLEYYGDKYHGNPKLFQPHEHCHPYSQKLTANELYQQTLLRERRLTFMGYNVFIIWEHDWKHRHRWVIRRVRRYIQRLRKYHNLVR